MRTAETVDILLDATPGRGMAHRHIAEPPEGGMMFSFASLWRRLYVVYRPRRPYERALGRNRVCLLYENMTARGGRQMLVADASVEEVPSPDVIVVPGGPVAMAALEDAAAVEWLGGAHETSRWRTTVYAPARCCSAPPRP